MYYKEHDKPYLRRKSWHKVNSRLRDAVARGIKVYDCMHKYYKTHSPGQHNKRKPNIVTNYDDE